MQHSFAAILACGVFLAGLTEQQLPAPPPTTNAAADPVHRHAELAIGDILTIHVLDLEEIPERPIRIDDQGWIDLPLLGHLPAEGRTPVQLEADVADRLRPLLNHPNVSVTVTEFREEPVTIVGAVISPGVKQVHGRKSLMEVLADAGGLKPDAGPVIKVTRALSAGPLPFADRQMESSGGYSVAAFQIRSLLGGENPSENIPIFPHDIVSVPVAERVFVLGEVIKPGAYQLQATRISILDALAQAGGATRSANASRARVLRKVAGQTERTEYHVEITRMLAGKAKEFELEPQDILYLPANKGKVVTIRAIEAMVGTGSSIAVFRGSR